MPVSRLHIGRMPFCVNPVCSIFDGTERQVRVLAELHVRPEWKPAQNRPAAAHGEAVPFPDPGKLEENR